jgi:ATP-dependent exoDNAse (exonuclease V) alpha subunit
MNTQEDAINAIKSGNNVALFASAGKGKSYIIKQMLDQFTVLVAPTGIAALNIGGETAHSIFGLPFGIPVEKDKTSHSKSFIELFGGNSKIKRVIFDEAPMLLSCHLDLIDVKLRHIKKINKPFGGIQVILTGDPFQLPPIISAQDKRLYRTLYRSGFIFDSKVWDKANFQVLGLDKVYRQSDVEQIRLLDAIRSKGDGWKQAVVDINNMCKYEANDNTLNLCVFNKDADITNEKHYKKNTNKPKQYAAIIKGKFKSKDCIVDPIISLKEGLRVIICANCPDKAYKNGQMGEIVSLHDDYVMVKLDNGDVVSVEPNKWESHKYSNGVTGLKRSVIGSCTQIPIRQGNSISIHKSQSLTLDNVVINMGKGAFSPALTYVALSRVRDLRNVALTRPIKESDIIIDKRVQTYYNTLKLK